MNVKKKQSFQTIQFSITTLFTSIYPIDRALSDPTTPDQSGLGLMAIIGYSAFPKVLVLVDRHIQTVYCYIQDTR